MVETNSKNFAIRRGFKRLCPNCGEAKIFAGYLKLKKNCPHCKAPIGEIRADDLPPYLTIFIVGHLVIPALLFVEATWRPDLWLQVTVWPLIALALCLSLLPILKGAVVGLMWSMGMKGDEQH